MNSERMDPNKLTSETEKKTGKVLKYPKSKNNIQCIGPCYEPFTTIVHPITLIPVTNDRPFCPIVPTEMVNEQTGKKEFRMTNECINPTTNKDMADEDLKLNMVIPFVDLDCKYFLKKYYNLFTFEGMLDWLEKKKQSPLRTRLRVIECTWKAYGEELDILDQRITDFYIELIKKKWVAKIVKALDKYIVIEGTGDKQKISLTDKPQDKNSNNEKHTVEKINFIMDKFLTRDDIYKFLVRYIKYRKEMWRSIDNHYVKMLEDLIEYIENKIKMTGTGKV
jgi:hypothetical protein